MALVINVDDLIIALSIHGLNFTHLARDSSGYSVKLQTTDAIYIGRTVEEATQTLIDIYNFENMDRENYYGFSN